MIRAHVKRFFIVFFRTLGGIVLAYAVCLLLCMFSQVRMTDAVSIDFLMLNLDEGDAPLWARCVLPFLWIVAFLYQIYRFSLSSSSKGACYDYLSLTAGKPYSYRRDAIAFWREEALGAAVSSFLWGFLCVAFDALCGAYLLRVCLFFFAYRAFYALSRFLWSLDRTGGLDGDPATPR